MRLCWPASYSKLSGLKNRPSFFTTQVSTDMCFESCAGHQCQQMVDSQVWFKAWLFWTRLPSLQFTRVTAVAYANCAVRCSCNLVFFAMVDASVALQSHLQLVGLFVIDFCHFVEFSAVASCSLHLAVCRDHRNHLLWSAGFIALVFASSWWLFLVTFCNLFLVLRDTTPSAHTPSCSTHLDWGGHF